MKIDPVKKAPVPAISGEDLLATVPDISKYATVEVENLANVPSDYMDADLWVKLQKGGCQLNCVTGVHTGTLSPNRMTN
jgi:L-asparaginase